MALNGRNQFWPDWNCLEWRNLVLAQSKRLGIEEMYLNFLKQEVCLFFLASSVIIATASSQRNIGDNLNYGPEFAIDEKIAKSWFDFFHSETELQPWLQIEFPFETEISSVEITNR
jgi:hypothetical protein